MCVQGSVLGGQDFKIKILLNKDLACDLLCEASTESGLIVSNFSRICYCVPDGWCFLSQCLCHSLITKVSSVCTTAASGLIREKKSQKVIHGLASLEQAIKSHLEA